VVEGIVRACDASRFGANRVRRSWLANPTGEISVACRSVELGS